MGSGRDTNKCEGFLRGEKTKSSAQLKHYKVLKRNGQVQVGTR